MTVRIEQIQTLPGMGRSLIEHDEKSRGYGVRGSIVQGDVVRRSRTHRRGGPYNQYRESSCVGQTLKGILNTDPLSSYVPYRVRSKYRAFDIYLGGQDNDEWEGREPEYYGTSANGACKYLRSVGIIDSWRWCFGADDVLDTLVQFGPVGIGVWWWSDMFDTDENGFIHPTGEREGGHEVEIIGINVEKEYVIGMNSWGADWGVNGRFKIKWEDLDFLLEDDGDAVTVLTLPLPA